MSSPSGRRPPDGPRASDAKEPARATIRTFMRHLEKVAKPGKPRPGKGEGRR